MATESIDPAGRIVDNVEAAVQRPSSPTAGHQWPALATDPGFGGELPAAPPHDVEAFPARPAYSPDGTPAPAEGPR